MMHQPTRHRPQFQQRIRRVRSLIRGTAERPRLAVFCGARSTTAQLINDDERVTVASASDLGQAKRATVASATAVGTAIAAAAKQAHITAAVFDRRGRQYHGRVKALAEAARAAGLTI